MPQRTSTQVLKLEALTKQIVLTFHTYEDQIQGTMLSTATAAKAMRVEFLQVLGISATEVDLVVLQDIASERPSVSAHGHNTSRRRRDSRAHGSHGKSTARTRTMTMEEGPSRKELLKRGLGHDGRPLKLAEILAEQHITLQATIRRLVAQHRFGRLKSATLRVQTAHRRRVSLLRYDGERQLVCMMQARARSRAARTDIRRLDRAARQIQRRYGGFRTKAKHRSKVAQCVLVS